MAGRAVQAPRYLLAVCVGGENTPRVHHQGFRPADVDRFAQRLLNDAVGEADGVLTAEIRSADRHHGRLAACYPRGSQFTDLDRGLLTAYAGHAAVVLEQVASLERARDDRDTAEALLELARALAGAQSMGEIGRRLVAAVPRVAEADTAAMWSWDEVTAELTLSAFLDPTRESTPAGLRTLTAAELPGLPALVEQPAPFLLHRDKAPAVLEPMFAANELCTIACIPILAQEQFLGLVTAGFRKPPAQEDLLFARLAGLADHAAVATTSARLVERISHQASHDALTGLANRDLLQQRGEVALKRAKRYKTHAALVFVDLDRFKNVNDTLGHVAGDQLIQLAAERIERTTRAGDTLGRLGGDEFLLLLPAITDTSAAVDAADRLARALEEPFELPDGTELFVSCSVGIACYPSHGTDYETLLRHADSAMYAAKRAGRDNAVVYADQHAAGSRWERLELESELHRAVEAGEITVFYQPQVDVAADRVIGVEALVRWQHPRLGLVEPGQFLELAEESGLIVAIDGFVRRTAFAQLRRWLDAGHDLRIGVNLSTRDLNDATLLSRLMAETVEAGIQPGQIELEITDRVAIDETKLATVVSTLAEAGFRIAIDDFGTGTSALRRLHQCKVNTVKIDRSFLGGVTTDAPSMPVVIAVATLAQSIGLDVIAEGVETDAQLELLREHGISVVQGYLLGRPAPAAAVTESLQRQAGQSALPRPRDRRAVTA
jgi:diguanylate cyclase (GGDEF)-like protein